MTIDFAVSRMRSTGWRASSSVFCTLVVLTGGLCGCASSDQFEHWRMTESVAPSPADPVGDIPASAVRVVFFRAGGSPAKVDLPVNVYINGQYQASLVGNTYTEQSLCPGTHRFAVQFDDAYRRYSTKGEGLPMVVSNQPMQYFSVAEDASGSAVLKAVDGRALQGVGSLRLLQSHTLPRVVRNGCAKG